MIELEEALDRILKFLPPATSESIPVNEADKRILAEKITSSLDLPSFDNSAMDGYALRAADVASASATAPARLRRAGRVAAGKSFNGEVTPGTCVRLFTGSPLPRGADAVVMQEDTRVGSESGEEVLVLDGVKPWENVRLRGEDIKQGVILAEIGEALTPARLCLLAATGLAHVQVGKQPLAGLIATGSELREPGQPLAPGQIYESNRVALAAMIQRANAIPRVFPLVTDDLAATRRLLENAFEQCDLVITSGGVSVGEMDFIKQAFEEAGGTLQIWKVSIKPGRPFVFGARQGKLLFGLPGNPVSALVTFLLLVRPSLLRWQGAKDISAPSQPGTLAEPLENAGDRRHFVRIRLDPSGKVWSAGTQASHVLSASAAASGLVDVPPGKTLPAGASVKVIRWD